MQVGSQGVGDGLERVVAAEPQRAVEAHEHGLRRRSAVGTFDWLFLRRITAGRIIRSAQLFSNGICG